MTHDDLQNHPLWDVGLTAVTEVGARELTPERFAAEFVSRNTPVLVRGALDQWPAIARWRSAEHLLRNCGPQSCGYVDAPLHEMRLPSYRKTMPLRKLFQRLVDGGSVPLWTRSLELSPACGTERLRPDVGEFSFLPSPPTPTGYPEYRTFFYRKSFTDWHYHQADETLMGQVVGEKEVLIAAPSLRSWRYLVPIALGMTSQWDTLVSNIDRLTTFYARVRVGDALYLPVYWWHVVRPCDAGFGATVAYSWASPDSIQYNPRMLGMWAHLAFGVPWNQKAAWIRSVGRHGRGSVAARGATDC